MDASEQDRRKQIMDAALRVFARHGFHGATIKRIAEEAGLKSPALIYWYFKNKDDLYQAVMMELSPLLRQAADPAGLMDKPPEEVLTILARSYLSTFESPDVRRLFRILISEAFRTPEVAEYVAERGIVVVLNFLVSYLQHQVDLGRLRPHDPQSGARAFLGMLVTYILGRELFPPLRRTLPDAEHYVEQIVAIFLDGLRVAGNGAEGDSHSGPTEEEG